ncbi:hypothetical protein AAFC00_003540 [Neodothiora populina]|uniref:Integral membrane protein n=1 Tax=Neodothiora populina TaxID=2781224 RepID=A0ABR3PEY5_9PEZI
MSQERKGSVPLQMLNSSRADRRSSRGSPSPARLNVPRARPVLDRRQPSIRLRRLPSTGDLRQPLNQAQDQRQRSRSRGSSSTPQGRARGNSALEPVEAQTISENVVDDTKEGNRRRSMSEPQRMQRSDKSTYNLAPDAARDFARNRGRGPSSPMSPLDEEAVRVATLGDDPNALEAGVPHEAARRPGLRTRANTAARAALGINAMNNYNERRRNNAQEPNADNTEYENGLVDFLDVVDPEVATLSTLTNVQNSLFIPDLGGFLNRRPTYTVTRDPRVVTEQDSSASEEQTDTDEDTADRAPMSRSVTITSHLSGTEGHYAVLPHGITLDGWSAAERQELNDHVRHLLHSRRAAFKRGMKGFGQYVRRPLGFFVTLYAFLITIFGLLWVLFLIGWISVGGRQKYLINIIDNIMVALFAVIGDGLAPFRAVDTYHMIYIAHYHYLTWNLRKQRNLPDLEDQNDLPGLKPKIPNDDESVYADGQEELVEDTHEQVVLTPEQQAKLKHHQDKFSKSHTFYKPHETSTHHAFPLKLLVTIVVLLDCHSLLQIALGTCTWAISYHVRPFALTTVILCFSLTCNITGGILISVGDRKTRKKDVVERMFRQQLTEQAMHKIEKRRKREQQRNSDLEHLVTPHESAIDIEEAERDGKPIAITHDAKSPMSSSSSSSPTATTGTTAAPDPKTKRLGEASLPVAATASVAGAY